MTFIFSYSLTLVLTLLGKRPAENGYLPSSGGSIFITDSFFLPSRNWQQSDEMTDVMRGGWSGGDASGDLRGSPSGTAERVSIQKTRSLEHESMRLHKRDSHSDRRGIGFCKRNALDGKISNENILAKATIGMNFDFVDRGTKRQRPVRCGSYEIKNGSGWQLDWDIKVR
jgi:hypothetical protein